VIVRRLLATALAASFALSTAAHAAPTRDGSAVKAAAHAAIARRLTALSDVRQRVSATTHLADANRTELLREIDADSSGLTALDQKIQADTDGATLRDDVRSIVTSYRVFVLMLPKAREVVVADAELAAADALGTAAGKLHAAIDTATAKGKDTTKAVADLAAMNAKTASARQSAASVPGQVVPLQPANYGTADRPVLIAARESLRSARADLRAARDLGHAVVQDLK
jgi:hypothetical protein